MRCQSDCIENYFLDKNLIKSVDNVAKNQQVFKNFWVIDIFEVLLNSEM